jgi:23S rRNA pseudouridine1911/1915/1917 synthase
MRLPPLVGSAQPRGVSDLTVVHEDEFLLVLDKPVGLPVTVDRGGKSADSLIRRVQAECGPQVINAHRIDTEVSGLVVCTKNKTALDFVSGQFQSKTAERVYRGFLVIAAHADELARITVLPPVRASGGGLPEEFEIAYQLAPDLEVPGRMHVYRKGGGRPALSHVKVLEAFGRFVWFEGRPETSREKQLQAHLAAAGAPVLGDNAHGLPEAKLLLSQLKRGYKGRLEEKPLIDRVALHLCALTMKHPETREMVTFESALPKEFEIALKNLRKFARG